MKLLEDGNSFHYLGFAITNFRDCEAEIKHCLGVVKNSMVKLNKIWKKSGILQNSKLTIMFIIATYAAETWIVKLAGRRQIDSIETLLYMRLLCISWR